MDYLDDSIHRAKEQEHGRHSVEDLLVLEVLSVIKFGVCRVEVSRLDLVEDESSEAEATNDDAVDQALHSNSVEAFYLVVPL